MVKYRNIPCYLFTTIMKDIYLRQEEKKKILHARVLQQCSHGNGGEREWGARTWDKPEEEANHAETARRRRKISAVVPLFIILSTYLFIYLFIYLLFFLYVYIYVLLLRRESSWILMSCHITNGVSHY